MTKPHPIFIAMIRAHCDTPLPEDSAKSYDDCRWPECGCVRDPVAMKNALATALGWKLTPREPTGKMIGAGHVNQHPFGTIAEVWQSMHDAAPDIAKETT